MRQLCLFTKQHLTNWGNEISFLFYGSGNEEWPNICYLVCALRIRTNAGFCIYINFKYTMSTVTELELRKVHGRKQILR